MEVCVTSQTVSQIPNETRPRQRVAARLLTAEALSEALEILPAKAESKFGISVKVRESGAHFRFIPARDPNQPRLWCVSVQRCSPGGMLDRSGPIWIDRPGRERPDIAELIETIRADIGHWLATPLRRDLCHWLLTARPVPTVATGASLSPTPNP